MPNQFDWSSPNLLMLAAAFLLKEFARKYPLDDGDRAKARDIAKGLSDAAKSYVWKPAASSSESGTTTDSPTVTIVPRDPGVEMTPLVRARRRPRPARTR